MSPAARSVFAAVIILFAFSHVAIPTLITEKQSADDLTWVARSLTPWWYPEPRDLSTDMFENGFSNPYYYSIHHPTLTRIVYRAVLHAVGVTEPPSKRYRYGLNREENMRLGNYLPHRIRTTLRLVNFAFTAAAVLLLYFGLSFALNNRLLALIAVAPIVFQPALTQDCRSVVNYLGADAMLMFWSALFWFAWLRLDGNSTGGAFLLGLLGGLATATKVNGAFLLIAAGGWYLFAARGPRRFFLPAVMAALSVAVFLALNPVYFGGGPKWAWKVFTDALRLIFVLKQITTQAGFGFYTRGEVILSVFPHLPFAIPITALILQARRAQWFPSTLAWTASVGLLNLMGVYLFFPRYAATVRVPFLVLLTASAASSFQALRKAPEKAAVRVSPARNPRRYAPAGRALDLVLLLASGVLCFLAVLDFLPFACLLTLVVAAVFAGSLLATRNLLAAAAVAAPLALFMPWGFSLRLSAGMVGLSLAAALLWIAWLSLETLADHDRALTFAACTALVALVVSPPSLLFVLIILIRQAMRPACARPSLLKLALSLLVAPVAVSIQLHLFAAAAHPAGAAVFPRIFSPALPLLWNVTTWSTAGHNAAYNNIVKSFNQWFYLPLIPALAVLAWPLRHRQWFAPTFLWGALVYLCSLVFGLNAYFQYSLPMQMALLVPFGLAGAERLMKELGVERK